MSTHGTARTLGRQESLLLRRLAESQRSTLSVDEDRELLASITRSPASLLSRMTDKGVLHRLGAGRYVVASWAGDSLSQAAPFNVLLDATLRSFGAYYLGFLSALVEHRLTDEDSWDVFVALRSDTTHRGTQLTVDGRPVHLTRISGERRWTGLERVRASQREYYCRSNLERTLVDTLYRPKLSGGIELTAGAWTRALARDEVDPARICEYARAISNSVERRAGFMLSRLGHAHLAVEQLGHVRGQRNRVLLDAAGSFGDSDWTRDTEWGVTVNVPERHLAGWLAR